MPHQGNTTADSRVLEIQQSIDALLALLPRSIDPLSISRSKLPFKVLAYRGALAWRIAELAADALDSFKKQKSASAILLTRGAMETSAALWYMHEKMKTATGRGELGDIDDTLMKLSVGWKKNSDMPQAINVLTFMKCVEKTLEGLEQQYDVLSEFAHPNYSGTTRLYCKFDRESVMAYFGINPRESDSPRIIGLANLSIAVMMFQRCFHKIDEAMPAFIHLCEASLKSSNKKSKD